MGDISAAGLAVLAVAAFLIGVSKTGFPGMGILAIPMVAMVLPAKASTGMILPMLIVGDLFAVSYYRRHAVWRHLARLLPSAAVGVVLGYLALGRVNDRQLSPIIGGILLVMLALNYWRTRRAGADLSVPQVWWFAPLLGLTAGVTTMMANAAGPIMVIYLVAMRLPKDEFIGTGAWYFLVVNCLKVPFSSHLNLINAESLRLNLMLVPLIVTGALLGVRWVKHVPEKTFTAIVQILAVAGSLYLVVVPAKKPPGAAPVPPPGAVSAPR